MSLNKLNLAARGASVLVIGTVLAGCEQYKAQRDSITPEHGNAVAHNIAVQTIDPWSPASRNTRIDVDGERVQVGVDRYKANKSIEPKGLNTQNVSKGSGGSTGASN